jgi:TorA maturation chaperone TorD
MTGSLNSMNTPEELLQAYTALFLFLGSAVSMSPDKSGLPHLCDSGLLRNLPVESRNKEFVKASRLLKSPCPFKQQCRITINNNYTALLSDKIKALAYPAATVWKNYGKEKEDHHRTLADLYSNYGYTKAEECTLDPDHLGIELLFVNLLLEKFLTEDDNEIRGMIRDDLHKFIKGELLAWLPRWAEKVSELSVTKCYTGISGLIIGGLEDVRDILTHQKLGL